MHVIGTAGHVDHGKSTLVKALTGMDPDRFEEEKRRGLTIDLGFAWLTLPSGRDVGIVDVPGHERFIRNMLAGVGGIDAALFVVASDEGFMPQSAEHLQILDFLGVDKGVVALTKSDAADAEMTKLVREDVAEKLAGTSLSSAPVVAVSAVTGDGLDDLVAALDDLLAGVAQAADRARPRMFVDRSFTITGAGTVVTGTLTGGSLSVGDEIEVLPGHETARVRSLQTHRQDVETAVPGSRVAANLVGLERTEVSRGDVVARPGAWALTDTMAVRLTVARGLDHPIGERGAYELYLGSAEVPCRVKFLETPPAESGARAPRASALGPGQDLLCQIFTARPLPVDVGDRFVIRDVGRWETVAGGIVLDPAPGRLRKDDPETLDSLRRREAVSGPQLVLRLVAERKIVPRDEIGRATGATGDEIETALDSTQDVVALPSFALDATHTRELGSRAARTLATHHAAHPLEPGLGREALRSALDVPPKLFSELLEAWEQAGSVVADGSVVRLPSHGPELDPAQRERADRALETLRAAGSSPPEPGAVGLSPDLIRVLQRSGELVVIEGNIVYPTDVWSEIERRVVALIETNGPATVAQVRDTVGTSRKYAVPLLEHLDTTGVTHRQGDTRVLGPRGRALAAGNA